MFDLMLYLLQGECIKYLQLISELEWTVAVRCRLCYLATSCQISDYGASSTWITKNRDGSKQSFVWCGPMWIQTKHIFVFCIHMKISYSYKPQTPNSCFSFSKTVLPVCLCAGLSDSWARLILDWLSRSSSILPLIFHPSFAFSCFLYEPNFLPKLKRSF